MVSRPYSDDQYPDALLQGDVLRAAFLGVQDKLKEAFPEQAFRHFMMPPSPTKGVWDKMLGACPAVALSWAGWSPMRDGGPVYRGTLSFPVFLLVHHNTVEHLYLGSTDRWGVGILGMTAMAVAMLHGRQIDPIGTMHVREIDAPAGLDWLDDRTALAGLSVELRDVALDDAILTEALPAFLRLRETWLVAAETAEETVKIRKE